MDEQTPLQYDSPQANSSNQWLGNVWGVLKFIGSVMILVFIINTFGLQSYEVFGQSMSPTLEQGDRLLISKLGKSITSVAGNEYLPDRGDIIVFHDPRQTGLQLVKRVIGLPGEQITLREGVIRIYNEEHPDGFEPDSEFDIDLAFTTGNVELKVPDGHVFVVGDNRNPGGSLDSRNELGTVPSELVVGRLVLRMFPLSHLSFY